MCITKRMYLKKQHPINTLQTEYYNEHIEYLNLVHVLNEKLQEEFFEVLLSMVSVMKE